MFLKQERKEWCITKKKSHFWASRKQEKAGVRKKEKRKKYAQRPLKNSTAGRRERLLSAKRGLRHLVAQEQKGGDVCLRSMTGKREKENTSARETRRERNGRRKQITGEGHRNRVDTHFHGKKKKEVGLTPNEKEWEKEAR